MLAIHNDNMSICYTEQKKKMSIQWGPCVLLFEEKKNLAELSPYLVMSHIKIHVISSNHNHTITYTCG